MWLNSGSFDKKYLKPIPALSEESNQSSSNQVGSLAGFTFDLTGKNKIGLPIVKHYPGL